MRKSCLLTLVYLVLLGVLIHYGMWIWLIIVILIGGVICFLVFLAILLELGFRTKYPLDFLAHTRWVNRYFEDKGFELVKHNTYNTDFPESIYRRNEVNVIVRLNAPITEHKPRKTKRPNHRAQTTNNYSDSLWQTEESMDFPCQ